MINDHKARLDGGFDQPIFFTHYARKILSSFNSSSVKIFFNFTFSSTLMKNFSLMGHYHVLFPC